MTNLNNWSTLLLCVTVFALGSTVANNGGHKSLQWGGYNQLGTIITNRCKNRGNGMIKMNDRDVEKGGRENEQNKVGDLRLCFLPS